MSGKMQKVQPLTDVRDYLITENISKIKENRLGKLKGRFKNEKIRKIICFYYEHCLHYKLCRL